MATKTAQEILTEASRSLVSGQDRFYAEILFRLRRRIENVGCPSMGVSMENGGTLIYNEAFVVANEEHISKVLVHECLHLICDHISRGQLLHLPQQAANICADLAVNSLIKDFPHELTFVLPDGPKLTDTVTVGTYKKEYPGLEEGKAFEWYANFFQEQAKGAPQDGKASDDHGDWHKIPLEARQQLVRKLIDQAVTATKQANQEVPQQVRPLIEELLNSGVSWEQVLKNFPQTVETFKREPDRMKRNRRYGTLYPGHRKIRQTHIAVLFDVSGSIGNEIVTRFANCIHEMYQAGCDITVLFFDDCVYEAVTYTPGCFEKEIPGGGGTTVVPAIDKALEIGVDGIICLTDGLFADTPERPGIPTVFGILEGYRSPVSWGTEIIIK